MHINKDFIIFQTSSPYPMFSFKPEAICPCQAQQLMFSSKVIEGCALSAHYDTSKL